MTSTHRFSLLTVVLAFSVRAASAQVQTGTPPFGSFGGGPDVINLANLNAHLTIPVLHKPGRGTDFAYDIGYDSSVWVGVTSGSTTSWLPVNGTWGWQGLAAAGASYIAYSMTYLPGTCYNGGPTSYQEWSYSNFVYHDPFGVAHNFNYGTLVYFQSPGGSNCPPNGPQPPTTPWTATASDGSGYTVKYTAYTVQTTFACSGVNNYPPTSTSLIGEIDLPDYNPATNPNSRYTFTYEGTLGGTAGAVTGRLQSVTLPTGGTITYTYLGGDGTHNGITCADGSAFGLKRYTPDTGSNYWQYDRAPGAGAAYTTTVNDPQGNQTVIKFQGIYETQREVYQGSSPGTLLATTNTCYNGSAFPCNDTAVALPITQRAVITTLPVPGSSTLQSKSVVLYNNAGVPTEVDAYAFGSGAPPSTPTRKTIITYASLGNITAFRQAVTTMDGSNSVLAQTNFNYDETTPTAAPAETAQLVSVSGSRGNLTSVQRCTATSGSCTSLLTTATMTYDTAGQVLTAKDAALNQTTFSYTDNYFVD